MKLHILGEQGPFPGKNGATSGYLLNIAGKNILLDCGSGVLGRLNDIIDLSDLDAIVISHLHYDHITDLAVLNYALIFSNCDKVKTFLPDGPENIRNDIKGFNMFDVCDFDVYSEYKVGDVVLSFAPMTHPVPSYAVKIDDGSESFVFSGDTNLNDILLPFATGVDMFLCNSGLVGGDIESKPHLSAKQAAVICKESKAKKCILTHFSPQIPMEDYIKEAKQHYNCVCFAKAFDEYTT